MVDLEHDQLLSLDEAARAVPPDGVHVSTIHRWRLRGIGGIKLATTKCGHRRVTSREALAEFFRATTVAADGPVEHVDNRARSASIDRAEAELERAGI